MVDVRAIFLGSKLKVLGTLLVLLVGTIGGAFVTGLLGAPSVVGVENRFGEVSAETTTIETDLIINNPNPVGVQLGGIMVNYTVAMNDIAMANGTKDGLAIERGNTTLNFTTQMQNHQIPEWWVSHIRNDERTQLEIDAQVHSSLLGRTATVPHSQEITTDIISQFNSTETRPVNANHRLITDPILYINQTNATWGTVSESETPIEMAFIVYNPKTTPYTITEIGYEITMNNISVGEGTTKEPYVIPGGAEETINTKTSIDNPTLDEWWVSHLQRDQVTDLRIEFYARIELPTGNTIRVPLDELTYTNRIETDFFGTKNTTEPPTESQPNGTPTVESTDESETPTSTTNGQSDTPTETTTPTPTPIDTPTDDGLLDDTLLISP